MFVPPPNQDGGQVPAQRNKRRAISPPATRQATRQKIAQELHELASDESDIEESVPPTAVDDDDLQAVLLQNRPLTFSRLAAGQGDMSSTMLDATDDARRRSTTTFRPTTYEQQVHDAITHPDNKGKDAQCVLEYAQQARDVNFRRTPPVLRGAYDFGFHVRGLSVAHFAQYTAKMMLNDTTAVVNMSDFSRKNCLPATPSSLSYSELIDSLRNLRQFGRTFYNATTVDVLDAAAVFVEAFGDGGEPDIDTTRRILLWLNMKLGKFRGLVLSGG